MALTGTATQSRDWAHQNYPGSPFIGSYAIDDNFETSVSAEGGTCAMARNKPPVWWQVDLHKVYEINKVSITVRKEFSK